MMRRKNSHPVTTNTLPAAVQPAQSAPMIGPSYYLYHGDCFSLFGTLADGSIDCVITDPPYGSTACAWDHRIALDKFWPEVWRVLKPAGVVVSFAAQPFATDLIVSARKQFRYELVWLKAKKVGFLNANLQPLRQHELMLVFCRRPKQSTYNPQLVAGKPYRSTTMDIGHGVYKGQRGNPDVVRVNHGTRHPTSVVQLNDFGGKRIHPTQKPEDLCRWLVRTYSQPGEVVLDPFAGSAATGAACILEGRCFLGFERDPANFAAAAARLQSLSERPQQAAA